MATGGVCASSCPSTGGNFEQGGTSASNAGSGLGGTVVAFGGTSELSSGQGNSAGSSTAGEMVIDVVRYDITANTATDMQHAKLTLNVSPPGGDCLTIACQLQPTEVWLDQVPARSFAATAGHLHACFDAVPGGGHELDTDVIVPYQTFHGDIGFSKQPDLASETFTYLMSWIGGCDHFGPCDHAANRQALYTFELTHEVGSVTLCPGTMIAGDTSTRCELLTTPAPTYSAFAWMQDRAWRRQPLLSAAGVDVVLYEVPGGGIAGALDTAGLQAFLRWMTDRFGDMPYGPELRIAGAPTVWMGFEHPANIVVQESLDLYARILPYANGVLHVIIHEIAHQWAGDRTTLASPQDFAWKEGLAEYLSYVFEAELRPSAEAQSALLYWDTLGPAFDYHVRPTDEPAVDVVDFYSDVYGVAPLALFVQLEDMLGRDTLLQAIAQFLDGGGARSIADWKDTLARVSGRNLDRYFDSWVFGAGIPTWPRFGITVTPGSGDRLSVTVTQTQAGPPFPCVVEVAIQGAQSTLLVPIRFDFDTTNESVSVDVDFADTFVGYSVDPRHRLVNLEPKTALAKPTIYWF